MKGAWSAPSPDGYILRDGWYWASWNRPGGGTRFPVKVTHKGKGVEAPGGWGGSLAACMAIGLQLLGPMGAESDRP